MIVGSCIFIVHDGGKTIWICGLRLCIFVGPALSASRTFLARLIPEGQEGQVFGLYATTGRAVSFMAPAAWSLAIIIGAAVSGVSDNDDAEHWGILGILVVIATGLLILIPVRSKVSHASALVTQAPPP